MRWSAIGTFLFLVCACRVPAQSSVSVTSFHKAVDCWTFEVKRSPSIALEIPAEIGWDLSSEKLRVPVLLRNISKSDVVVNSNLSPGHKWDVDTQVEFLIFDDQQRSVLRTDMRALLQTDAVDAEDYKILAPNEFVKERLLLVADEYRLAAGDYILKACFLDNGQAPTALTRRAELAWGPVISNSAKLHVYKANEENTQTGKP